MILSATQAAKETGKTTATITRAIKSRKLSGTKMDSGGYEIEASELFRVFPRVTDKTPSIAQSATPQNPDDTGALRLEVERLREALRGASILDAAKEAQIADLRARLDVEGEERRKLTAILMDQREKAPPLVQPQAQGPASTAEPIATAPQTPAQGGLWSWLVGR